MNPTHSIKMLPTKSLTTVVHQELACQIIAGNVLPGEAMLEVAIASDLGISRGPVPDVADKPHQ